MVNLPRFVAEYRNYVQRAIDPNMPCAKELEASTNRTYSYAMRGIITVEDTMKRLTELMDAINELKAEECEDDEEDK